MYDILTNRFSRLHKLMEKDIRTFDVMVAFSGSLPVGLAYLVKKVGCLRLESAPPNQVPHDGKEYFVIEGCLPSGFRKFFTSRVEKLELLNCYIGG